MQPRESSLDHPPICAQPATVRGSPLRQLRTNTPLAKLPTMWLGVVSTVSVHLSGAPARTPRLPAHGWNRINQRQQLRNVVLVRCCQNRRERDPVGVGDEMMLAARLAPVHGTGTGFFPHHRPREQKRCQRPPATSRSCPRRATWQAAWRATSPTRLPAANLEDVANMSCPNHIPSPGAASPTEYRSSARTGCRSAPFGSRSASDRGIDNAAAWGRQQWLHDLPQRVGHKRRCHGVLLRRRTVLHEFMDASVVLGRHDVT